MDKKGGRGCAVSSYRATDSPIYNERTATTKEEKKRNETKRKDSKEEKKIVCLHGGNIICHAAFDSWLKLPNAIEQQQQQPHPSE